MIQWKFSKEIQQMGFWWKRFVVNAAGDIHLLETNCLCYSNQILPFQIKDYMLVSLLQLSKVSKLVYISNWNRSRGAHPIVLWGVYIDFIISLFLDRLDVKNRSAIRRLFVAAVSFSVSDSWFGSVYSLSIELTFKNSSVLLMLYFSKCSAFFVGMLISHVYVKTF